MRVCPVCTGVHAHASGGQRCLPQVLSTLLFETGPFLSRLARLAEQQGPKILLDSPPQHLGYHTLFVYMDARVGT